MYCVHSHCFVVNIVKLLVLMHVEVKTISPTLKLFSRLCIFVDSTCLIGLRVLGYLASVLLFLVQWLSIGIGLSG